MATQKAVKVIKRIRFDPEFQPVNVSPVIKQRVLSAYDEAKEIVARARQEAARIRSDAGETIQRAKTERESERQKGFDEGYQEGLGRLTERILDAEGTKEKILAEAEPQIIRMVMDIAEKVIGRQIEKGAVVDVVKKSIAQSVGRKIVVRIHPSDVPTVKEREKELMIGLEQNQSVSVKEDEEIPPGGCIVETEMGTVDARLETQIQAIKKALGLVDGSG